MRPFTKTTNAKPKRSLVGLVQPRELREDVRLGAALLLGGLADRADASPSAATCSSSGSASATSSATSSGSSCSASSLDEARPPREERRQLVGAQLPR